MREIVRGWLLNCLFSSSASNLSILISICILFVFVFFVAHEIFDFLSTDHDSDADSQGEAGAEAARGKHKNNYTCTANLRAWSKWLWVSWLPSLLFVLVLSILSHETKSTCSARTFVYFQRVLGCTVLMLICWYAAGAHWIMYNNLPCRCCTKTSTKTSTKKTSTKTSTWTCDSWWR